MPCQRIALVSVNKLLKFLELSNKLCCPLHVFLFSTCSYFFFTKTSYSTGILISLDICFLTCNQKLWKWMFSKGFSDSKIIWFFSFWKKEHEQSKVKEEGCFNHVFSPQRKLWHGLNFGEWFQGNCVGDRKEWKSGREKEHTLLSLSPLWTFGMQSH